MAQADNPLPLKSIPLWLYVVITVLLMIVTGGAVYIWQQAIVDDYQQQLETAQQQLQQTQEKAPLKDIISQEPATASPRQSPPPADLTTKNAFIAAINAKDFATIESMLAATVTYTKFETECCGDLSRSDTMRSLQTINHPVTYNFSPTQDSAVDLITSNPLLSGYTVGIGDDNTALAFKLNAANQVSAIFEATLR
jgi:cytoskeletal protein RodZ